MSKFQIILISLFVIFTVGGLTTFALFKGSGSKQAPLVTVWGTLDSAYVRPYIQQINQQSSNKVRVDYIQKTLNNFDSDLLEALAIGQGPDAILASQDQIFKQSNKLYKIGYNTFSANDFKTAFVPESELFLTLDGSYAIPFSIDPMVMYWNRDIFTNANISQPPKSWDEFRTLTLTLTKKDAALNITQSAVALGEYRNIDHAKDILSLLVMQAGDPIMVQSSAGYQVTLGSSFNYTIVPANAALTFYTQFADPLKPIYTWNRALPSSKTLFLSNKLGVYFGYASEYQEIQNKNPNLNFGVALMPQSQNSKDAGVPIMTFGKVYGFALLKSSRNPQAAYADITALTSKGNLAYWTSFSGLPSVRRDALNTNPGNAAASVFAASALQARGWLDPDRATSETIFKDMIEGITSGRLMYNEAIEQAQSQLKAIMPI